MPSMAFTCARAASCKAASSIFAPMTIILSTAFITSWGDCPGMGLENSVDVQSTSLMKGYAAADNLLAAASTAGLLADAALDGAMGWAFTTLVKSIKAEYAAFASCSLTVDMRYAGTFGSTKAPTELYTSMVLDSGTEATMRPMAAKIAVNLASEHTPLAGRPWMAAWWASAPAFNNFGSMAAPMSIILLMAFAQA